MPPDPDPSSALRDALLAASLDEPLAARLLADRAAAAAFLTTPGLPAALAARAAAVLQRGNQFAAGDDLAGRLEAPYAVTVARVLAAVRTAPDPAALRDAAQAALDALAEAFRGAVGATGRPGAARVVCAEYDPALQLRVLGLDPAALRGPVLDLGCGAGAALVKALRARGIDARGVDPSLEPAPGLRRGSWFEVPGTDERYGTLVSHLGFSLHFLHHHLRPGDEALRYARRYMDLLRALAPGGTFAYAPGLPFVEAHLPATAWRVERTEVPIPRPDGMPEVPGAPWYGARVTRL